MQKYFKLNEVEEQTGIPAKTLRKEVHAGRLRCIRARPGPRAPILISEDAFNEWLRRHAAKRQLAPSP